ncbi:hypothetical protein HaLaN_31079, partial [Haematococcus lacustris]
MTLLRSDPPYSNKLCPPKARAWADASRSWHAWDINCSRAGSSMYLPPPCFNSCNKDSTRALEMHSYNIVPAFVPALYRPCPIGLKI